MHNVVYLSVVQAQLRPVNYTVINSDSANHAYL